MARALALGVGDVREMAEYCYCMALDTNTEPSKMYFKKACRIASISTTKRNYKEWADNGRS